MGNITAAAQALYISQSAVSQSIKQLERDLQTRLFARNSRGVTLTADGQMLYEYVRSAMGLLETGEEKLSQTRELQMGQLTIGASDTVTSQFLLPYLDTVPQAAPGHPHPDRIRAKPQGAGPAALRQGGYRLCQHPADDAGLRIRPCFDHPRHLCGGGGVSLRLPACLFAGGDRGVPADPAGAQGLQPFVSGTVLFLQNGLKLNPEIELGARSLLVDLAAIGFGVAGVTEEFVRKELDSGRLKKLKTSFEIPARSVDMCLLSDVPLSAAAERFTDFVKDSLSKL